MVKMKKESNLFDYCIIEMGKRVGLHWETYDEVLAYTKEQGTEWYKSKRWSVEEQEDFSNWMKKYLKDNTNWLKSKINQEVAMFLLNYGWTQKQDKE